MKIHLISVLVLAFPMQVLASDNETRVCTLYNDTAHTIKGHLRAKGAQAATAYEIEFSVDSGKATDVQTSFGDFVILLYFDQMVPEMEWHPLPKNACVYSSSYALQGLGLKILDRTGIQYDGLRSGRFSLEQNYLYLK